MRVERGVADQRVDAAEALPGAIGQGLQLPGLIDVAGDGHRLAAIGADVRRHWLARFEAAAGNDDFGAVFGKSPDDGFANAPARTGHQRDLASQVKQAHFTFPLYRWMD